MKTIKIKTNVIFGIVALLLAITLWCIIPSQIPHSKVATEYIDGSFIPKVMAILMGICGLSCILKSLFLKDSDEKEINVSIEARNCAYLAMVVIYGVVAVKVSFLLSSLIFGSCSLWFLRCRSIRKYVLVSITIIVVCLVFKYGLKVRFGGIWGI